MNKIHKTLAIAAAAAVIAGINVWSVHDSSRKMDLLLGDVESAAFGEINWIWEWTWNWRNGSDSNSNSKWREEQRPCPRKKTVQGGGNVGITVGRISVNIGGNYKSEIEYPDDQIVMEYVCPTGSGSCIPIACP